MTIELLDTETEDTEKSVANAKTWDMYVERHVNPTTGTNIAPANSSNSAVNNNDTTNADSVEIKTEKMDEDAVSSHC